MAYEEAVFLNTIAGWIRLSQLREDEEYLQSVIARIEARKEKAHQPTLDRFKKKLADTQSYLQLRVYHVNFKPEYPLVWEVLEEIHEDDKPYYYQEGMMYG